MCKSTVCKCSVCKRLLCAKASLRKNLLCVKAFFVQVLYYKVVLGGISKSDGRRGAFEEDLQRCMSRGRRSTKDMFIRDVRRSGR